MAMAHTHWSDDDLVLAAYGELALEECAECQARLTALRTELDQLADPVPERGEDYGRWTWFRLQPKLPAAGRGAGWKAAWRVAAVAGVAVAILGAFVAGRYTAEPAGGALAVAADTNVRVYRAALGTHFERAQLVLREIENTPAGDVDDFSGERRRAERLLTANRLYRQEAALAGDPGTVELLEDVERILLEVAHAPETVAAEDLDELRGRIRQQRITFRMKVGELQQEVLSQ